MKNNTHIRLRRSQERGHAEHGWLNSYHSFSFADYYDPQHMGYRSLRVINEDYIDGGQGFGAHPHKDMEIITYMISGSLRHEDSMGHAEVIKPGDIQKMSAGTGVVHSEVSASPKEKVHLLQIWILPEKKNLKPSYAQISIKDRKPDSGLLLIGANREEKGIIPIYQDVELYFGRLGKGKSIMHSIASGRGVWVQMIAGKMDVAGEALQAGDAIAVENEKEIRLAPSTDAEFLLFDLK